MRKRESEAWAKWRGVLSDQKRSGQSVAGFCRERGICAPQFFAWKKRLNPAVNQQFVAVRVTEAATRPASGPAIEIRLGAGRSIMVEPGFDADHLRALLAVLEARA